MDLGITTATGSLTDLRAGDHPVVSIPVVIVSGSGSLVAGTVLGRVTASEKYGEYDDTAIDGTETARAILAIDVDATSADVNATAYVHGEFDSSQLTGIDAAGTLDLLALGVYVKSVS